MLGKTLGQFSTAYLDDVLIYIDRSKADYIDKVKQVLKLLRDSRLNLDLSKSVFAAKTVKYLGFIVNARKAICLDLEKLCAVNN